MIGEDVLLDIVGDFLDLGETSAVVFDRDGTIALSMTVSEWCRLLSDLDGARPEKTQDGAVRATFGFVGGAAGVTWGCGASKQETLLTWSALEESGFTVLSSVLERRSLERWALVMAIPQWIRRNWRPCPKNTV
ncbi:MAG: hypothetical protein ACUVWX_12795 [Kiritimatiellia bacterium]